MAIKTLNAGQFHSELKIIKPASYLFYGDEGFLKRRELEYVRSRIITSDGFDHYIFTGENYSPDAVMTAIMTPPMLNSFKLVEFYGIPFAEFRRKEDIKLLTDALSAAAESDDTVLIIYTTPETFDPGEAKAPSQLMKLICEYATPVEFVRESGQRLVMWVQKHFSSDKIIAEPAECSYLISVAGNNMSILESETAKLCAYLHANNRERLTKADIDLVTPKNKEIGDFEFADAILSADCDKAFSIFAEMKKNNEKAPMILAGMSKVYCDLLALKLCADAGIMPDEASKRTGLHPYVAKIRMAKAKECDRRALEHIISLMAETDAELKTGSADEYILIERLIVRAAQYRRKRVFN